MAVIDLPASVHFGNCDFWLVAGGEPTIGLNGKSQSVFSEDRYWEGSLRIVPTVGADMLALRSVGTRLRGSSGVLRVPVYNPYALQSGGDLTTFRRSVGVPEVYIAAGSIPYSDGSRFSDGSGFALPTNEASRMDGAAAAGATSMRITGFIGRNQLVGVRFSINDFLYEIETSDDGLITFSPPLREAVADNAVIDFDPHIRVRLLNPRGWESAMNPGNYTSPMNVTVIEAFER